MKEYVFDINDSFTASGSSNKQLLNEERKQGRREGIYFTKNMKKGEKITAESIEIKRPAVGIRSRYISLISKGILNKLVNKGQPVYWNDLEL